MVNNNFRKIFKNDKPIIGMIHLAGGSEYYNIALEEIEIYSREGLDGIIVENYHGSLNDVVSILKYLKQNDCGMVVGINILPNEFKEALDLAYDFGCGFIQLDYVSGTYGRNTTLPYEEYKSYKEKYSDIVVMGGVWPKYYNPNIKTDEQLEQDLEDGMNRAEVIVVTGSGTGQETPFDKIKRFRNTVGDYPLIVGAGMDLDNVHDQLAIADGAIVGSYFKDGNTVDKVNCRNVEIFMREVRRIREV